MNYQRDEPDEFYHRYSYDADNRITQVRTSADGNHWHTDARYFYSCPERRRRDAHGPLQRVELGAHKVQGIDYAYTLQGWLKGINSNLLAPTVDMGRDGDLTDADPSNDLIGRDAYGLSLGYYGAEDYKAIGPQWTNIDGRPFAPIGPGGTLSDEHRPLYNGNIAHTVNTLQPFGLWNSGNGAQGQVLAQVYQYDQLNRLKQARGVEGLTTNNRWQTVTDAETDRYRSTYTYDANGNITAAERWDRDGNQYDDFSYKYEQRSGRLERNRLYQLYDDADAANLYVNETNGAKDIAYTATITDPLDPAYFEANSPTINEDYNYRYDQLGNLIKDDREGIANIQWTVASKVKQVEKTDGTVLTFAYGADGQRLWKEVTPPVLDDTGYREYYIRDAQGNIMATYRSQLITVPSPEPQGYAASMRVTERPVYGSSRLGTYARWEELYDHPVVSTPAPDPVQPVDLNYELTDHLGNVTAVVTGRLLNGNGGGTPKQAELVSAQGYEAFGALLPGKNYSSDSYRFGFNGQEKDNEVYGSEGTSYTAEFWQFDPRVGRRWNLDPKPNPSLSQYSAFELNPILYSDPKGDTIVVNLFDSKRDGPVFHNVANTSVRNPSNDGVFLVYAHAHHGGIQYTDAKGKLQLARNAKEFNRVMGARSPEYAQALKEGRQIVIKLYACNVAAEEYVKDGKVFKKEHTIAEQISEGLPEGSTVIAANGFTWFGTKNGKPVIKGVQETSADKPSGTGEGGFEFIRGGKTVAKRKMAYDPDTGSTKKGPKKKLEN